MQYRSADQQADDHYHAGADQFFRYAQCLEPEVQHQGRRHEEYQAAHLPTQPELPEKVGEDVAAAGHIGDQCTVAVGGNGNEDQPATEGPEVLSRQAAKLFVLTGAQAGFSHVQHGDDAKQAGDRQAYQQRDVADFARGKGHAQNARANVGADDDTNGFRPAQGMRFQS
ncbi:hypothetical protein D3C77_322840 [compost metagenome]